MGDNSRLSLLKRFNPKKNNSGVWRHAEPLMLSQERPLRPAPGLFQPDLRHATDDRLGRSSDAASGNGQRQRNIVYPCRTKPVGTC